MEYQPEHIYQAKDVSEKDIDNYCEFIEKNLKKVSGILYRYTISNLQINNIDFIFMIDFINNKENNLEESNYYRLKSHLIEVNNQYSYVVMDSCDTLKELITKHINTKYAYCKISNDIVPVEEYIGKKLESKIFPKGTTCCVCLDDMDNDLKTYCEHSICLECFKKLKKRKCPICRKKNIVLHIKEDDLSDSDSD